MALVTRNAVAETAAADKDEDASRPQIEAEGDIVGRVTYGSARGELPVTSWLTLVALSDFLYLAPVTSDPAHEFHPYLGAGVQIDPGADWNAEASLAVGPRHAGSSSLEASLEISKGIGADWDNDRPPPVELAASINLARFAWNPPSPIGSAVDQLYLQATAVVHASAQLEIRPRVMWFFYDQSLAPQTEADVDSSSVLARVGTYAPRAAIGGRVSFRVLPWMAPLAQIDELAYADGIGSATQIEAGARLELGTSVTLVLAGGLLHNRLAGIADTLPDARTVPVVDLGCEIRL